MTDEEESSKRLRDPVHVTLITCCIFVMMINFITRTKRNLIKDDNDDDDDNDNDDDIYAESKFKGVVGAGC